MKLKSVFVRFHKSFNYDYRRKIEPGVNRMPWEFANEQFYPHVEIPIDAVITTVVGANESGKSHLLSAIEKGITGRSGPLGLESEIERKDFCRYSHFFKSTSLGSPRFPDFGFQWADLSEGDITRVLAACDIEEPRTFSRFFFFRRKDSCQVYLPKPDGRGFDPPYDVTGKEKDLLPPVFRIDSQIALPDRVSIEQLLEGRQREDGGWRPYDRNRAFAYAKAAPQIEFLLNTIATTKVPNGQTTLPVDATLKDTAEKLVTYLQSQELMMHDDEKLQEIKAFNLAYDLLFKIAGIETEDIEMLRSGLQKGETGVVRSVVDKINHALAVKLRFPRVWSQDRNFALRVEATDHELGFIINDRTGCQYSFDERSSGLKHFLSYYIQYLTHEPPQDTSFEILLMDEPDAFLSGEAQQDLLKIFQMFSDPVKGKGPGTPPVQVIYVTHSPFLIDKNHAERIRALEKPEGSKGTKVIKAASQNRYEPIRSAFGPFVGETTFMSHCNLMVEGLADQILLAGAATYLRRLAIVGESEMLDLNRITIVPAGGASHIPYLTYLARGRDPEKPAVIVLLDSDSDGDTAKNNLGKDGPHPNKKRLLDPKFILQLGDIAKKDLDSSIMGADGEAKPFRVLEDLVPLPIAVRAAIEFAKSMYDLPDVDLSTLSEDAISDRLSPGKSPFDAIKEAFAALEPAGSMDIDKVPFARSVIELLPLLTQEQNGSVNGLDDFEANMRAVFKKLRAMQSAAESDKKDKRMREIVDEKISTFLSDFEENHAAIRDDVSRLLSEIEGDLEGDDHERAYIIQQIGRLREAHNLNEDPTEQVNDFEALLEGLALIRNAKEFVTKDPNTDIPVRKKDKSKVEDEKPAERVATAQ